MEKTFRLIDTILTLYDEYNNGYSWSLDDASKGVQIFGGTGSGKSSGSGKHFAIHYLDYGFGGLVMCAKNDEKEQWLRWAKYCNREDDVIIFSPNTGTQFNFLNYELNREGEGGKLTFNIVEIFMQLNNLKSGKTGGGSADSFWDDALNELLTNTIDLLKYSETDLTVDNLSNVINSIARNTDALRLNEEGEQCEFIVNSFCYQLIEYLENQVHFNEEREEDKKFTPSQINEIQRLSDYFLDIFPAMDERVQSTIIQSYSGIANRLGRGVLRQLFSQGTNITPEDTLNGKIIILDLSIHEYGAVGRYGQILFKYMWQKAIERRPKNQDKNTMRPVFLWVDESQLFMTAYDMIFQTTARSSRACTVYLSQNISNYYAVMPGKNAVYSTNSLLGNLNTKIFHANDDYATNSWASKAIGNKIEQMRSGGASIIGDRENNYNMGFSETILPILEPNKFRFLQTGGADNRFIVEGIVLVTGKSFSNEPFLRGFFKQKSPRR